MKGYSQRLHELVACISVVYCWCWSVCGDQLDLGEVVPPHPSVVMAGLSVCHL